MKSLAICFAHVFFNIFHFLFATITGSSSFIWPIFKKLIERICIYKNLLYMNDKDFNSVTFLPYPNNLVNAERIGTYFFTSCILFYIICHYLCYMLCCSLRLHIIFIMHYLDKYFNLKNVTLYLICL